jgi:hypothetical protein
MSDGLLKACLRPQLGREKWDAFVASCDQAWLWHFYDLQDAISTWRGKRDMSFAVLDGDTVLAVIPLHAIEYREAKVIPWAVLDSLGGIACKNDLGEKHQRKIQEFSLGHIQKTAEQLRAVEINMLISPMAPAYCGRQCPRVNPLLELGFDNVLTQTWVMDLQKGGEAVWAGFEKRARTAIRKAEKLGVQIRMAEASQEDLDIYYRLHSETYTRTGVRPHPKAYFEAIWRDFLAKGLAYIFFAEYENKVVAAENFGVYKDAAIYWTGASSTKGLELQASSLVQWSAMKKMIADGIAWYETGEAFPNAQEGKTKGLNDFKSSFGGELYPLYRGRIIAGKRMYGMKQAYLALKAAAKG